MGDEPKTPEEQLKDREAELARLSHLVYYDELTGLFNRRGFLKEAERMFRLISYGNASLERRTGFRIPFSIVFADIDNFKSINDTYGHAAGDEALKTVAQTLHRSLRIGDLLGRLGGEEFVIALIGAGAERGARIAKKLCAALEEVSFTWEGTLIPLTASFGVAEYANEPTLLDVVGKADRAMYRAKEGGRNRVAIAENP